MWQRHTTSSSFNRNNLVNRILSRRVQFTLAVPIQSTYSRRVMAYTGTRRSFTLFKGITAVPRFRTVRPFHGRHFGLLVKGRSPISTRVANVDGRGRAIDPLRNDGRLTHNQQQHKGMVFKKHTSHVNGHLEAVLVRPKNGRHVNSVQTSCDNIPTFLSLNRRKLP